MPQLNSLFWFLLWDYCHQLHLWKLNWSGGLPVLDCTEDRNTCKYSSTCWCFCLAAKSSDSENASRKVCWDIRDSRASRADTRQYRTMKLGQYASKWTTQTESERTAGDGAEDTCVWTCLRCVWSHLTQRSAAAGWGIPSAVSRDGSVRAVNTPPHTVGGATGRTRPLPTQPPPSHTHGNPAPDIWGTWEMLVLYLFYFGCFGN